MASQGQGEGSLAVEQNHECFQLPPLPSEGSTSASPGPKPSSQFSVVEPGQTSHESIQDVPTLSSPRRSYAWKSGVWARLPWFGLGALLGAVLLTGAAVIVLAVSNGSPIENWQVEQVKIQPQVWVSIFSTITNALLAYSLAEGLAILFWRQAGRGTTLRNLHDNYESESVTGAAVTLLRGKLNIVAVACLLAAASAIRGPLFQRASTVDDRVIRSLTGQIELQVAQSLPPNYFMSSTQTGATLTSEYEQLVKDMTTGASQALNLTRCGDTCTSSVKGVGFGITCESSSYEFNIDKADMAARIRSLGCSSWFGYDTDAPDRNETFCRELDMRRDELKAQAKVFAVGFQGTPPSTGSSGVGSGIVITSAFKDTATCKGTIPVRRCTLLPGLVEYTIMIKNDTISLQHPHWQNDTFLQAREGKFSNDLPLTWNPWQAVFPTFFPPVELNLTEGPRPNEYEFDLYSNCPEGEFSAGIGSNTTCRNGGPGWQRVEVNDLSRQYLNQPDPSCDPESACACTYTWHDPMQDMLDGMRQVAFRASLSAAAVANRSQIFYNYNESEIANATSGWAQTVPYTGTEARTVYRTNWAYVASAVVVSLTGVLAVLPLYYGWWELGRSISLNPLEIAKAFGAPLLASVNSNADRSAIVRDVGHHRVRYGVVPAPAGQSELEDGVEVEEAPRWRLRVERDDDHHVGTPNLGQTFE